MLQRTVHPGVQSRKEFVEGLVARVRRIGPFGMGEFGGDQVGHNLGAFQDCHRFTLRPREHFVRLAEFGDRGDLAGEEVGHGMGTVMCNRVYIGMGI